MEQICVISCSIASFYTSYDKETSLFESSPAQSVINVDKLLLSILTNKETISCLGSGAGPGMSIFQLNYGMSANFMLMFPTWSNLAQILFIVELFGFAYFFLHSCLLSCYLRPFFEYWKK